jgi:flagellar hook protein FlgE
VNRALYAGLAGTMNNQVRLDTIGNNLANSNTTGFKQSRVSFHDTYYQTLRGGASAGDGNGGINPVQVGSGNALGAIQTLHTQGSLGSTGQPLDAAIEGPGMFVLGAGESRLYTRDGSFSLDDSYTLVSSHSGLRVQGWMAQDGAIDTTGALGDLRFPVGELSGGQATGTVTMAGNVRADADEGAQVVTSIQVYDSLSETHDLTVTLTRHEDDNTYDVEIECGGETASGQLTFDGLGVLSSGSPVELSFDPGGGAAGPQTVAVDFSGMTQLARASDAVARTQDGRPAAALVSVSVQGNGVISGNYSDGSQMALGQMALASFANTGGLERVGNNMYAQGSATGAVMIGAANSGGRGKVASQALELSNVDLTEAFVDMISTQRAFQASTRVISAADKLLEEVMRLARA